MTTDPKITRFLLCDPLINEDDIPTVPDGQPVTTDAQPDDPNSPYDNEGTWDAEDVVDHYGDDR